MSPSQMFVKPIVLRVSRYASLWDKTLDTPLTSEGNETLDTQSRSTPVSSSLPFDHTSKTSDSAVLSASTSRAVAAKPLDRLPAPRIPVSTATESPSTTINHDSSANRANSEVFHIGVASKRSALAKSQHQKQQQQPFRASQFGLVNRRQVKPRPLLQSIAHCKEYKSIWKNINSNLRTHEREDLSLAVSLQCNWVGRVSKVNIPVLFLRDIGDWRKDDSDSDSPTSEPNHESSPVQNALARLRIQGERQAHVGQGLNYCSTSVQDFAYCNSSMHEYGEHTGVNADEHLARQSLLEAGGYEADEESEAENDRGPTAKELHRSKRRGIREIQMAGIKSGCKRLGG